MSFTKKTSLAIIIPLICYNTDTLLSSHGLLKSYCENNRNLMRFWGPCSNYLCTFPQQSLHPTRNKQVNTKTEWDLIFSSSRRRTNRSTDRLVLWTRWVCFVLYWHLQIIISIFVLVIWLHCGLDFIIWPSLLLHIFERVAMG